jgi:FdhD protein
VDDRAGPSIEPAPLLEIEVPAARSRPRATAPRLRGASAVDVWELGPGKPAVARADEVAREEPLEIRLNDEVVAVIMRTPGDDERLALGFLLAEGIVSTADDLASLAHCGRVGTEGFGNVINAVPAPGSRIEWDPALVPRRATVTSSACGVCGRLSIEDLLAASPPLERGGRLDPRLIASAVEGLQRRQPLFGRTGGTHGAAAHDRDGAALAVHEDVGRHNAVDKVVGALAIARRAGDRREAAMLVVSGRAGFEIVQKAVRARIPVVASVSAPTSLSVDLAERAGITLVGFARQGRMNVYAHAERVEPDPTAG